MAWRVTPEGIVADIDGDANPLAGTINRVVSEAKGSGKRFDEALLGPALAGAKKLQAEMRNVGSAGGKAGNATKSSMKGAAAATIEVVNALKRLELSEKAFVSALVHDRELTIRAFKDQAIAATNATNAVMRDSRNANAQEVVLIQQQTAAAKSAASARLQAARFMYESLGRLEKGFGRTVSAVARTLTSAFGKGLEGLGSLFHRSNTEMTSGLQSSLTRRESILHSSFSRQDKLVNESISRESRKMAELRTASQTGVLGAASRSGLFGGLAVGFAGLAALKSTFTIGADFTRGLAVLQAQLDLTGAQMKSVRQLAIDLGNDISLPGVSALDAAQAIQILTKQFGFLGPAAVDAAEKAAKGTLQLGRAAGVTAEEAAGIIGSAVNVFGIGADKAVEIADQITGTLAKAAGVSFEDFQTSFVQGATVFNNFVGAAEPANEALLDFNTTLAVLAKNGIVGETAGAGLKQFFLSASKQSDKAIATQKELAKRAGTTGTVFFDAAGKARKYNDSLKVIREGLKGYTDEQKQAILTTLFGVRSQTIASAIIKTSQEDYDKLRGSIQQQGLAAKVAAAQNTGLKGALDALKSILETLQILLFEKINKPLREVALGFANFLNTLFFANGVFAVVRTGLLGMATGIGAVLGVKVAIELFSLFTTTLGLFLTPMGAVVAAAGLLGAAINLLRKDLPEVDQFFGNIRDSIAALASGPLNAVKDFFGSIVTFFSDTPTQAAAAEGGGNMVRAFNGGIEKELDTKSPFSLWVRNTLIPALQDGIGFVREQVIPVFVRVGEVAIEGFGKAETAVLGFYHRVQPVLQPAIDGFQTLAKALGPSGLAAVGAGLAGFAVGGPLVGAALAGITLISTRLAGVFGGDLGDVGAGGRAAAAGLGKTLGNVGAIIKDALAPVATEVGNFLGSIFTGANLAKFETGFLTVVERVGFVLGNLITNPKVVAAVGLIAAGAVVVGFRFVEGFAKGVIDNIPALFHGAAKLIGKALFDPSIIVPIVLGVFAFTKVLQPLLASFRNMGTTAGKAFGGGLGGAVRGGKGFLSTLFGGSAGAGSITKQIEKEMIPLRHQFQLLGGDASKSFDPTQKGLRGLQGAVKNLEKSFSPAELAGIRMRDRLQSAFTSAGLIKGGIGGIVTGVKQIGAAFRDAVKAGVAAAGGRSTNFLNMFHVNGPSLTADAAAAGTTSGRGFGGGLITGISNGLETMGRSINTAWAGLKQQAAEQGTTVGRQFGSAALVGLGGFMGGKAEGGIGILSALGAGLTGLALGSPLVAAVGVGAAFIGAAFGNMGKAAEESRQRVKSFADGITNELKQAVDDGVVSLKAFRDGLKLSDVSGLDTVQDAFKGISKDSQILLDKLGINFKRDLEPILASGSLGMNDLKLAVLDAATAAGTFGTAWQQVGADLEGNRVSFDVTAAQQREAFRVFITEGTDGFNRLSVAQQAFLGSDAAKPLRDSLGGLGKVYDELQTAIDDVNRSQRLFGDTPGLAAAKQQTLDLASGFGLSGAALDELYDASRKPAPTTGLDDLTSAADTTKAAVDGVIASITQLLQPTSAPAIGQAILDLRGAFDGVVTDGVVDQPSLDVALGRMRNDFTSAVSSGIGDGTVFDQASLQALTDKLRVAAEAGVTDPSVKVAIEGSLRGMIIEVVPKLKDLPPGENLTKGFTGFTGISFDIPKVAIPSDDEKRLAGQAADSGRRIGGQMGAGVAQGLRNAQADINRIAAQIVEAAGAAMRGAARIRSPSLVFAEIGAQIGAGLAKGIADSETDISSAVTTALDGAIAAAQSSGSRLGDALRESTKDLFGKLTGTDALVPGPGNSFDLTSAMAALTQASQSVLSGFDSNAKQLFDVSKRANDLKKDPKLEPLSNADKSILGSDLFSLDVSTIFGSSNVSSFASALDSIANLGETLLAQGRPAEEVANTLQGYVDRLVDTGVSLGFNRDRLLDLVDTLGLSDEALAAFVKQVNDLGSAASQPPGALPPGEEQQLNRPVVHQTIYLPTTDSHAAALTVANSLALAGYLPGA